VGRRTANWGVGGNLADPTSRAPQRPRSGRAFTFAIGIRRQIASADFDESLNTLHFANRCQNVNNQPHINYVDSGDENEKNVIIMKLMAEIAELQQRLQVPRAACDRIMGAHATYYMHYRPCLPSLFAAAAAAAWPIAIAALCHAARAWLCRRAGLAGLAGRRTPCRWAGSAPKGSRSSIQRRASSCGWMPPRRRRRLLG
jgi:hypothetical protein